MAQATGTSVFSAPSFDGEGLSSKKKQKERAPKDTELATQRDRQRTIKN